MLGKIIKCLTVGKNSLICCAIVVELLFVLLLLSGYQSPKSLPGQHVPWHVSVHLGGQTT